MLHLDRSPGIQSALNEMHVCGPMAMVGRGTGNPIDIYSAKPNALPFSDADGIIGAAPCFPPGRFHLITGRFNNHGLSSSQPPSTCSTTPLMYRLVASEKTAEAMSSPSPSCDGRALEWGGVIDTEADSFSYMFCFLPSFCIFTDDCHFRWEVACGGCRIRKW